MRDKQILLMIMLLISLLLLFATDYYVATSDLNVRSGEGKTYSIVFTLQEGSEVEVLSKNGNWYKIKYSKIIGYAHSSFLTPRTNTHHNIGMYFIFFLIIVGFITIWLFERWLFDKRREQRRDYYRNVYLKSDDWQRKRNVVLKRDNWHCVYCGSHATQVHHKRYAKINIGKEPIHWLVSVCNPCHEAQHN